MKGDDLPFYRRFPGDYLKETAFLGFDLEDHGAYSLMLDAYWVRGPQPELAMRAAINCQEDALWEKLKNKLSGLFKIRAGIWHHERLDAERERSKQITRERKKAGKAGAKAFIESLGKRRANAPASDTAKLGHSDSEPDSHSQIDRSTHKGAPSEPGQSEFEIPTLDQVGQFASEQKNPEISVHHAEAFFKCNQDNGWRINGERVRHWRKAFLKFTGGIPSSLDEVKAHCRAIAKPEDIGEKFWNYLASIGWMRRGMIVTDWKREIANWTPEEMARTRRPVNNRILSRTNNDHNSGAANNSDDYAGL
jgi:uncharacterized protein YdaU (DUF1376 family)